MQRINHENGHVLENIGWELKVIMMENLKALKGHILRLSVEKVSTFSLGILSWMFSKPIERKGFIEFHKRYYEEG